MATGLATDTSTSTPTSVEGDSSERLQQRLSDPRVADGLNRLLDRVDSIAFAVEAFEGFLRRGDTIVENVAGVVHDLKLSERQMDMEKLAEFLAALPKLQEMGEHVLKSSLLDDLPKVIDAGVGMINAGMLDKEVVATLGDLGKASVSTFDEVKHQNPPPISGLWATMRAMKDPEVQQTMGFAFAFAKAFAKHLK